MTPSHTIVLGDVKLLLDENVDVALAVELRRKLAAVDVLTAGEAGTRGLKDPELLEWAAAHDRVLVTHDKRTMPDHFYDFLLSGRESPGIVVVPQDMSIGRIIDDLLLIVGASRPEEYRDLITRLPM